MLRRPHQLLFATCLVSITLCGCGSTTVALTPSCIGHCKPFRHSGAVANNDLALANAALTQAKISQLLAQPRCVDQFFEAAVLAWPYIVVGQSPAETDSPKACEIYHQAIAGMINQAPQMGRFDRVHGVKVCFAGPMRYIPFIYHGQSWLHGEFEQMTVVEGHHAKRLNHYYKRSGLGVTAVAFRDRGDANIEPFTPKHKFASATIVMRPNSHLDSNPSDAMVIEIYDPLRTSQIEVNGQSIPLAADYTAPLKAALANTSNRDILRAFLQPGQTRPDESGLFMLERYQPGKIPVLFVHGLLSDRYTWANFVNEMRYQPDLMAQFQIWSYQYPTGEPFLRSAARLRRELADLRQMIDPAGVDLALNQTVMVGHSMGGLITKLQITSTQDDLWRAVASRSIDEIVIDPDGRSNLMEMLFFEPSPMISRAIFIGTPHRGSAFAQRAIGRFGSLLVREPEELRQRHRAVMQANPGVFSDEVSHRLPTSIDLLNPSSDLLRAIASIPTDPAVQTHSIVGSWRWMIGNGDSDGVVPVKSARTDDVITERVVIEKHTELPHNPDVIDEVFKILREHSLVQQFAPIEMDALPRLSGNKSERMYTQRIDPSPLAETL